MLVEVYLNAAHSCSCSGVRGWAGPVMAVPLVVAAEAADELVEACPGHLEQGDLQV